MRASTATLPPTYTPWRITPLPLRTPSSRRSRARHRIFYALFSAASTKGWSWRARARACTRRRSRRRSLLCTQSSRVFVHITPHAPRIFFRHTFASRTPTGALMGTAHRAVVRSPRWVRLFRARARRSSFFWVFYRENVSFREGQFSTIGEKFHARVRSMRAKRRVGSCGARAGRARCTERPRAGTRRSAGLLCESWRSRASITLTLHQAKLLTSTTGPPTPAGE